VLAVSEHCCKRPWNNSSHWPFASVMISWQTNGTRLSVSKRENPNAYRDHLANERTFLALVRTGVAIVVFGFAIGRFAIAIREFVGLRSCFHKQPDFRSGSGR